MRPGILQFAISVPLPASIAVLGHHDLDGIVSAAIVYAFLRDRYPATPLEPGTVDFHLHELWPTVGPLLREGHRLWRPEDLSPAPSAIALVDFPLPPMADDQVVLFADHHATAFEHGTEPDHRRRLAAGHRSWHGLRGSCAEILLQQLATCEDWHASPSLLAAAALAHCVDTAGYAKPIDALRLGRASAPSMDLWIAALNETDAAAVVRRLGEGVALDEAFVPAAHADRYADRMRLAQHSLLETTRLAQPLNERAILVDHTNLDLSGYPRVRYAEYIDPSVRYAVLLSASRNPASGQVTVAGSIGRSPWATQPRDGWCHPDLGRIARTFAGGGGHPFAAGFRRTGATLAAALVDAQLVVARLAVLLTALPAHHEFADCQPPRERAPLRLPSVPRDRVSRAGV